jgi:hypothetical protein
MYRILVSTTLMEFAAEAAPFRRLCDVHLNPGGGEWWTRAQETASHSESVAAFHVEEASPG